MELAWKLGPAIVVAVILIVAFFLSPRILSYLELEEYKWVFIVILVAIFLFSTALILPDASKIILDLKENTFVTYIGEIDFLSDKSSAYTDIFQLTESSDKTIVEASSGMIEATIQTCYGRIVYAENSKIVLEFEVYEVTETRDPIIIH